MITLPFENYVPTRTIWVSTSGSATGTGSQSSPLSSIQAAVNLATPGTAIMVEAGTYTGNIKINVSGTPDAPIQLISADGPGAAKILPSTASASATIEAFGEENIVVRGFDVSGGKIHDNGIQFGMSGTNFSDMTKNIVLQDNIVHDTVKDCIKVSQGDYVYVVDNTVSHGGDQGVDFVAVNNSVIARNDISYITGPAALFAKGGSTNVLIAENKVTHSSVDGIEVGGYSDPQWMRPGFTGWEAKNVTVVDNIVEGVGKRPLNIIGAQNCTITHNLLQSNPDYYYIVSISADNNTPARNSNNIVISDNTFDHSAHWLQVLPGQGTGLQTPNNHFDGVWTGVAGPHSAPLNYDMSWLPHVATTTTTTATDGFSWTVTPSIHGTTADELVSGTWRNDTISGSGGSDTLAGSSGNDTYLIDGNDHIVEAANGGMDLVMSYQSYTLENNVEKLQLMGSGNLNGIGNGLPNIIVGNVGDNLLDGAGCNDRIEGGAGNDTILGGINNDNLLGGGGNDRIDGGSGSDWMSGGAGSDTFVFGALKGHDIIADFQIGTDHLEINATSAQTADLHIGASASGGTLITYNHGACQIELQGVDPHAFVAAGGVH